MNKTAIVLFADLPEFEARAKSFCGISLQKATQKISTILTHHFYQLAKQTTAETFLIDTFHQKGKSFGERIANAFAAIYAKGFENVICIGNDCPDLKLVHLQSAIELTESGNVVLGPTMDAGAYLIAIPKNKFHKKKFQHINWQNSQTLKDLKTLFDDSFVELEVLTDIDHESDFSFSQANNPLTKHLLSLIKSFGTAYYVVLNTKNPVSFLVDLAFLKGPPQFSI